MSDIAYVCLSDMHFGAANSLLTNLDYNTLKVDPRAPSPVLLALVDCLAAALSDHVEHGQKEASRGDNSTPAAKPTLVLNGDIFELALARDNEAVMAFERFLELAFKERQLFERVVFLPGNHDHHLWETARETQYQTYIGTPDAGEEPKPPWHTTRLRDDVTREAPVRSPLLSAILKRHDLDPDLVEVRYPNYGLLRDEGRRAVVFHHGHFVEPIYTAMSIAQQAMFPPDNGYGVADWEAQNFAWIDFVWSTLGRSGDVGEDVGLIYDMLQDPKAVKLLADRLLAGTLPRFLKGWKRLLRWPLHYFLRHQIAHGVAHFERRNPAAPLSESAQQGLQKYLEWPLAGQLYTENCKIPEEVTFIFGHTHKPFQRKEPFAGYPGRVSLYNSGGWVVDTTSPDLRQGAAVILVDDDLNTASLHLYQQTPGGPISPVKIEAVDPFTNALFARLETVIDADDIPWKAFTTAISENLPRRRDALQRLITNGIETLSKQGSAPPRNPPP